MTLGLRAGDWVEVRSAEEIAATLDEDGRLDALPFMPEMLRFCGERFQVHRRADKTCDTIGEPISLRMMDAVHLQDLRCDGSAHGGCQAQCLIFWKEAWLERSSPPAGSQRTRHAHAGRTPPEMEDRLRRATRRGMEEERFVCQATELQRATTPMEWWEPGQYWRELRSGNVSPWLFLKTVLRAAFNFVQRKREGLPRPCVLPRLRGATPREELGLRPGDLVRIKSKEEIEHTLDGRQKNRGLYFDVEMVPYCGEKRRVKARVERIVDEKTGRMLQFDSDCIMLERVTCGGRLSYGRLFCPRSIHSYWREIWLEPVADEPSLPGGPAPDPR